MTIFYDYFEVYFYFQNFQVSWCGRVISSQEQCTYPSCSHLMVTFGQGVVEYFIGGGVSIRMEGCRYLKLFQSDTMFHVPGIPLVRRVSAERNRL